MTLWDGVLRLESWNIDKFCPGVGADSRKSKESDRSWPALGLVA